MKTKPIAMLCLLIALLSLAAPASADDPFPNYLHLHPSPADARLRLASEPQLYFISAQSGIDPITLARLKIIFDADYGVRNGLVSMEQWRATWESRLNEFALLVGGTPVFRDNGLSPDARRLMAIYEFAASMDAVHVLP